MNGKDGEIQVSVAANETVGAEGQTIMIIQADEHLDPSQVQNALNNANITEVANVEVNILLVPVFTRVVFRCLPTLFAALLCESFT